MNRRLIPLILLVLAPSSLLATPQAHANYRIVPTAMDTWPSTYSAGSAIVNSVTLGQASSQGTNEILAAGSFTNNTATYGQLRIYHKAGSSLALETSQLWRVPGTTTTLAGVQVADIDGTGQNKTITLANIQPFGARYPMMTQIGVYRWTGASLIKGYQKNYTGPGNALETRSLAIWTYNGVRQIVTLGYYNQTGIVYAQLGIWSWDGATFNRNTLWNWTTSGSGNAGSQGFGVTTGQIEGAGTSPDIITVGSSSNGTVVQSEIRIWGWSGSGTPLLKQSRTWLTTGQASAATGVTIRDLQNNGSKEIVVAGQLLSYPFWKGELTIWQYNYNTVTLTQAGEASWQSSSTSSYDLVKLSGGDVDNSGTMEIVTAGYSDQPVGTTDVLYGEIRVWTWTGTSIILQKSYQYTSVPTIVNAVTVGDVDKVGRQDIILGGQQLGKGMVEVRDVAFVSGTLTLETNPSPAQAGRSVTVSGTLANTTDNTPVASAPVLLEYANGTGSYQILATVTTDPQGRFATSFTPPGPGSYTLRATWNGDETHTGASLTTGLTANRAPSVIVLSSSSFNAQPGDTVKITGYLYPATATSVTLTYNSPTGTSTTHTVNADNTGLFTDTYAVNSAGTWTITATWAGNPTTAGSNSNTLDVQTQPQPIGLTLSLYGFIIAIAAAGLAAFSIIRKSSAPKTMSSTADKAYPARPTTAPTSPA